MGSINLRWYQQEAVNSVFDYFMSNTGNPIISLPTGTGKSIVQAEFFRHATELFPEHSRFLALTHVKELVAQNARKLSELWPGADIGIYSAGLRCRDTRQRIVFANVQSVVNRVEDFGHRDIVFVDECHLVNPKQTTRYQAVLEKLRAVNPCCKIVGMTATPYRLGQGPLTEGDNPLFSHVCYDLTDFESFNRLVAEGYLATLTTKKTSTEIDTHGLAVVAGEFNQKQVLDVTDKDEVTNAAVDELLQHGADRRCWLIFASGIDHVEKVSARISQSGIACDYVHSKMTPSERDKKISDLSTGRIRCLVNHGILTTGFDCPQIDLIGVLKPTMSASLWVQMLGRGTRPSIGKSDCLVLDWSGNTRRLGPINDPVLPVAKGKPKQKGQAPVKVCSECECYNHASARVCSVCGEEFKIKHKLTAVSAGFDVVRTGAKVSEIKIEKITETLEVNRVYYTKLEKRDSGGSVAKKPPMLRIMYLCGSRIVTEVFCLEHDNAAKVIARKKWRSRYAVSVPDTVDEAIALSESLPTPSKITAITNQKYPEITNVEFTN